MTTRYFQSVIASLIIPPIETSQVILEARPKSVPLQDSCCFYEQVLFKEESLQDISRGGFTSVWLPPASKSVQLEGYLPGCLYDLDSFYGSQAVLERLVNVLKERGLQVWIDWPLKRRCLREQDPTNRNHMFVTRPIWTADCLQYSSSHRTIAKGGYPKLLSPSTTTSHPPPHWLDITIPIDVNNNKVRQDLFQWADWLESQLKVDGLVCDGVEMEDIPFLLDWMKHEESRKKEISSSLVDKPMSSSLSSSSPTLFEEEWKESFIYTPTPCNNYVSIALVKVEYSRDNEGRLAYDQSIATEQLVDFIHSTYHNYALIDTVTRAVLEAAVVFHEYWRLIDNKARLVGLLGRCSDRAITVLDTVDLLAVDKEYMIDTGGWVMCKTQHLEFPQAHILKGYAYLLTHPGIPCIHWDHYFDQRWRRGIEELMQVRKGCHIHASSRVYIESACAEYYAAFVDKQVAMKIGRGDWHPTGPEWKLCTSGWEYAVWKKRMESDGMPSE